jgi:hypothetical protein
MNRIRASKGKSPRADHAVVVIDPDRIVREPSGAGGTHA